MFIKSVTIKLFWLFSLVLLLAISAQMKINLISSNLPLTLQTYTICIIVIFLPINLAFFSVFLYILFGILGFPVFAGGANGISILLGYSGGYIVGFLLATVIICIIRKTSATCLNSFLVFIFSIIIHLLIILSGFIWLGILKGLDYSFCYGLLPLLLPAFIKSLTVLVTYRIYRILNIS